MPLTCLEDTIICARPYYWTWAPRSINSCSIHSKRKSFKKSLKITIFPRNRNKPRQKSLEIVIQRVKVVRNRDFSAEIKIVSYLGTTTIELVRGWCGACCLAWCWRNLPESNIDVGWIQTVFHSLPEDGRNFQWIVSHRYFIFKKYEISSFLEDVQKSLTVFPIFAHFGTDD